MQVLTNKEDQLEIIFKQASKNFNYTPNQIATAFKSQFAFLKEDIKKQRYNILSFIHIGKFRPHIRCLYKKELTPIERPGESEY